MKHMLEIQGLCKTYGDFALRDVNLVLPGGSILGLIGENGAGKSTLFKCILNLTSRSSGSITVLGRDNIAQERQIKQDVGVVTDECPFHESLRPRDLASILSGVYKNWDGALFSQYLRRFSLPEGKSIREFSRGMKMKLSLCAALAHHPRLLLLDEATSGLDPVVRDEILDEFLAFIQDEEHAILVSSHITTDLEKVADYIAYLHRGELLLSGTKDEILQRYGRVVCTAAQLEQLTPGDVIRVRRSSFGCQALTPDREAFCRSHPDILVEPAGLEDIMLLITKGEEL